MPECPICNKKFELQEALIQHLNNKKDEKHHLQDPEIKKLLGELEEINRKSKTIKKKLINKAKNNKLLNMATG